MKEKTGDTERKAGTAGKYTHPDTSVSKAWSDSRRGAGSVSCPSWDAF